MTVNSMYLSGKSCSLRDFHNLHVWLRNSINHTCHLRPSFIEFIKKIDDQTFVDDVKKHRFLSM